MNGSISVVVPVYNSELTLRQLVARLEPVLNKWTSSFEVILVNDGSRDASWKVISELAGQYNWVQGIDMMRNYGQHNALLCGIRAANSEIIVTMDDDLQNPPEEIPSLLNKLSEGYDVVYGTPQKEKHSLWRIFASWITKLVLHNAMGAGIARNVSAFRAFRSQVQDAFVDYRSSFVSLDVLLTWSTTRFAAVPVRHDKRTLGVSNYTLRRLILHTLNMMTGFSALPLRIASIAGFMFTLFGIGVLIYVIGRYLILGGSVPGFPFLACLIAIFSGTQLFALGIIGEYLARVHFRMMERPSYTIRSTVGKKVKVN